MDPSVACLLCRCEFDPQNPHTSARKVETGGSLASLPANYTDWEAWIPVRDSISKIRQMHPRKKNTTILWLLHALIDTCASTHACVRAHTHTNSCTYCVFAVLWSIEKICYFFRLSEHILVKSGILYALVHLGCQFQQQNATAIYVSCFRRLEVWDKATSKFGLWGGCSPWPRKGLCSYWILTRPEKLPELTNPMVSALPSRLPWSNGMHTVSVISSSLIGLKKHSTRGKPYLVLKTQPNIQC